MRYVWDGERWVTPAPAPARAESVGIIRDFAEPLLCHADGRMHSSRSTYDAAVKAAGCEIIGKTEARRMAEAGQRRVPTAAETVATTMRRIINGG
jgi:hypothetical protein